MIAACEGRGSGNLEIKPRASVQCAARGQATSAWCHSPQCPPQYAATGRMACYPITSMPEYGAVLPNIRLRYGTMLPNSTSLGSAVWRQGEGPGECVCRQMHYEWAL